MKKVTRIISLLLFITPAIALAGKYPKPLITIPLTANTVKTVKIGHGLLLSAGDLVELWGVKVVPDDNSFYPKHCFDNLVGWAFHGPDANQILPWQVATKYFPNTGVIPICCFPLQLVVRIVHPKLAGGPKAIDKYFVGGTLTVAVEPGEKTDLGDLYTR